MMNIAPMTTASTAGHVAFRDYRLLHRLCFAFLIVWIVSAIRPVMVADWWLENLLVFGFVGVLIATYRFLQLSELSYWLIFAYLCLHEWGAHHMYANVPIGEWMRTVFHTTRNDYDRVVHFSFGLLLAYPEREVLMRKANLRGFWTLWIPVVFSLGLGAFYEIMEAIVAVVATPDAGDAFLSLQGDPWDTHKDMFMGFAGSIVSMGLTGIMLGVHSRRARDAKQMVASVGR
jgi:putative membrane protein